MDVEEARQRLRTLQARLAEIIQRDPDQEVQGMAIPPIDALINASRGLIADDDEIAAAVRDIIDPDAVASGNLDAVRAVDAIHVVDQLLHSLPPPDYDLSMDEASQSIFKPEEFGGPWR